MGKTQEQALKQAAAKRVKTVTTKRVVITGMGAITPAGMGVEALWNALLDGECCISKLPEEFPAHGFSVAGQLRGYDPLEHFTKKETRRMSRFVQMATLAADEAFAQAGIDMDTEDATRFACVFGTGIGGIGVCEREVANLLEKGPRKVSPLFVPMLIGNMAAGDLAIRYGLKGACTDTATACATGTHCIGEAYRLLKFGYADAALCGGTEESMSPVGLNGFGNLGALSKAQDPHDASKPFDVNRNGFVPGEGAGAVVLETLEHAQARGAHIIAEVAGFGSTGDGYHMTAPDPTGDGALRSMRDALDEAGFEPTDIGHINAHGTATHANDAMEALAINTLCGEAAAHIPVVSIKGCTGHMLGAAGAVEAIITAKSVVEGIVPPTIGFNEPDPECNVCVSNKTVEAPSQMVALSNSFGFGGHNATLAICPFVE